MPLTYGGWSSLARLWSWDSAIALSMILRRAWVLYQMQFNAISYRLRGRSQTMLTKFWLFWPPTPLRWHFLWYKHWQKVDIFGPPNLDDDSRLSLSRWREVYSFWGTWGPKFSWDKQLGRDGKTSILVLYFKSSYTNETLGHMPLGSNIWWNP